MNRWQSQNSYTKSDFERITTANWRVGLLLPDISGSALNRRERVKKEQPFKYPKITDFDIDEDGDPIPENVNELRNKTMSARSARKIRQKFNAMYRVGLAKTFVTLTMCADCSDRIAIRCLQKLFKLWRDQWGKFNFLWVAERQGNGRIHFHMALDRFIDVVKENGRWYRLQYNAGLIYSYELGFKRYPVDPTNMSNKQIQKYVNGLQVDKIYSIDRLSHYLASYITKHIGEKFGCQVWNCSKGVSALFTEIFISTDLHNEAIKTFPGSKNIYVYSKDVVNKSGKKIHSAGEIVLPVDRQNDHASWVYIVNKKFAESWLQDIDEINKAVVNGGFAKTDICYYSYDEYCDQFQPLEYLSFNQYRRRYHNKSNMDCRYNSDLEKFKIDTMTNFYQLGKAQAGRGKLCKYSDYPTFDKNGRRYYGGVALPFYSNTINKLKLQKNEECFF